MTRAADTYYSPIVAMAGGRLRAEATLANRDAILAVLERVLPAAGTVLEVGSGTGEHAIHFAPGFPALTWQPSDPNPEMRASIAGWAARSFPALPAPLDLDVRAPRWPLEAASAVVAVNLIHIAPWATCLGLMAGAGRLLEPDGVLYLYGAYRVGGRHTHPDNAEFDQGLRRRNPEWGVRDLEEVVGAAAGHGLEIAETVAMPANNLSVVFRKGRGRGVPRPGRSQAGARGRRPSAAGEGLIPYALSSP